MPKECIACNNELAGIEDKKRYHTCDVDKEVKEHQFKKSKILFESERGSRFKLRNDPCKHCSTVKKQVLKDGRVIETYYDKDNYITLDKPSCD